MTEHTPGPWHVEGRLVADAHGDIVANEIDSRESRNLIAAAPDMLEALEAVMNLTKVQQVLESWELGSLNAILAKAKGK